tara:strand:- start:10 stop:855 length:846 start_codon:yes stop_codon:yes gene_type:complete
MKLLLSVGHCYASTTSLFYTLSFNHHYCHTGANKENAYLWQTYLESRNDIKYIKMALDHYKIAKPDYDTRNYGKYCKKLIFTEDIRKTLGYNFKRPFTIENYCNYYKNVYEIVKDEYESVGDFSTATCGVSEEFLWIIKPILQKYFDIKITMTFRDPIRRFWSQHGDINADITSHDKYAENYQKYCNVFGKENVHYVIVEDLWSGETSEISRFLNYDIRHLGENMYWPLSDNTKKHEFLKDQWGKEKKLPENLIPKIRQKLDPLYLQYEQIIGRLPERWIV